jgi:hypothetical protein
MSYVIVPATQTHVGPLVSRLGHQTRLMLARGRRPRRFLREFLANSAEAQTVVLDGAPVAMWGYVGGLLAPEVYVWFCIADAARRHVRNVVAEARAELSRALEVHALIRSTVSAEDERALRFARFLGFEVAEEVCEEDGGPFHWMTLRRT